MPHGGREEAGPWTVPFRNFVRRRLAVWENRFVNQRAIVGKAFIIYWSWKYDENMELAQREALADKVIRWIKTTIYNITHLPFVVRWGRLGQLIQ